MSSFSWADFLNLAEALRDGQSEAHWRSAASRAYYAAFHYAKSYVLKKYGPWKGGSEHERTWRALAASDNKDEQLLGNWGDDLKRVRTHAEYDVVPTFTSQKALQAVFQAKKLLSKLDALKSSQS